MACLLSHSATSSLVISLLAILRHTLSASSSSSTSQTVPTAVGTLYYWRVKTWDSGDAEGPWSQTATFTVDRIKVSDIVVDLVDGKLYAKLRYESDDAPVNGGEIEFLGITISTNSTGWAVFTLSGLGDFPWGSVCSGVSDGGLVTICSLNQSVALAKAGPRLIGGNCTVASASWIGGQRLEVDFNVTVGTYQTLIKGPESTYVLNATWLLSEDYSDGVLSLSHDGSRDIEVYYVNWGGLRIEGLTWGWLESASLVAEELTIIVNGSAGVGTLYVNCSGWGAPYEAVNFTSTLYDAESQMFTGTYQLSSPLTLILRFGVEGPGSGTPSGDGATSPTIIVNVEELRVSVPAGGTAQGFIAVTWSGTTTLTLTALDFSEYQSWFTVSLPQTLTGYRAEIPVKVKPPRDAEPGNYSEPMTLNFQTAAGDKLTAGGVYHIAVVGWWTRDELEEMTDEELRELLKRLHIEYPIDATKEELIDLILDNISREDMIDLILEAKEKEPLGEFIEKLEPIVKPVKELLASKVAQMIGLLLLISMALAVAARR